ncbi:metal-dependent transcriptional regulator [bacterium]|nr:metal-dependent transcriptional regulator [bacterium]
MSRFHLNVSPSAEEYLLTLFRLECEGEKVGTSRLAKMFEVKAPSVTGMLRRLHTRGWVHYRRYRPPELTEEGRAVAVRLIRRHRLLESFLVRFLNYGPNEVHEEVQILEHSVSERLLNRIDEALGHPAYDPHGDPIPDESGNIPDRPLVALSSLQQGKTAVLSRVDNRHSHVLNDLKELGAYPGMSVELQDMPKNGKLTIRAGEKELCIDREVADVIYVRP